MTCENVFCIYQRNNECVLEEINLDITGACIDCIHVDIDPKKLTQLKENQFRNIENRCVYEKGE